MFLDNLINIKIYKYIFRDNLQLYQDKTLQIT